MMFGGIGPGTPAVFRTINPDPHNASNDDDDNDDDDDDGNDDDDDDDDGEVDGGEELI